MARILDACCGSRMFWFNKGNADAVFVDNREESHTLCDGRKLEISPTMKADFRDLPFDDNTFKLVVFDPPHLERAGKNSWMLKKYGKLGEDWRDDLTKGFKECFRVLDEDGVLVFKWNEVQIPLSQILKLTDRSPLFGHRTGRQAKTHWVCFINS